MLAYRRLISLFAFVVMGLPLGLRAGFRAHTVSHRPEVKSGSQLPARPDTCYLPQADTGSMLRDRCGHHDGMVMGHQYQLTSQGIHWSGGGSPVITDVTRLPRSVLACFTHEFGGTGDDYEVTKGFEKYPTLLSSDATKGGAISMEGQDGSQQGLDSANLGFLYFAEGGSPSRQQYVAATRDGTNGGPHCLIVDRTAAGGDRFYLDGAPMAMAYNASTGKGTLGGGHLTIGGSPGDPDSWFHGTLHLLVLWDEETLTSQARVNQALSWANDRLREKGLRPAGSVPPNADDLQSKLIIVGDSITQCAGAPVPSDQCWAKNISLDRRDVESIRMAVGGSSGQFTAVTSPWREATLIDPRAPFNVAQFYYGINDGCRNHFSEEQVWQRAVQWSRLMHQLGVKTLFTTMIDIDRESGCGNHNESGAQFKKNLNAIARGHYQGIFDGLVDFAAYPELGADGASLGRCFGPDKIHPSVTCQKEMRQMAEDSINYLLAATPTYVRQPAYTMGGGDKEVIAFPSVPGGSTITLPSCYGKTYMPYTILNGSPPSASGKAIMHPQTGEGLPGEQNPSMEIPAGHSITVMAIVPNPATGGCTWITM